jgi:hypothetical protein
MRTSASASALARLEARIALADHEHLAATTDDLAVAMALLCGLEGRQHFHGTPRNGFWDTGKPEILAEIPRLAKGNPRIAGERGLALRAS